MKLFLKYFITTAITLMSTALFAHTDEALDQLKSQHGGQTRMAGPFHLEIVINPTSVDLYVTDHAGSVKEVSKAHASATALSGKNLTKLDFRFVSANLLRANNALTRDEKLQIVVQFKASDGIMQQAKFTPFKKNVSEHQHDDDQHHDHNHQTSDHQHQD